MTQEKVTDEAFVTLATNNSYALGALALAQSLLQTGTRRSLVCMVTNQLTAPLREELAKVYTEVLGVDVMDSEDPCNLALLQRPDLGVTFTKLHCWKLVQFKKCVFLDADTLVLQNIDDLFEREELSAAADIGWPDCFNSGVFVFKPSMHTYSQLLQFAIQKGSYDGGDQGLLNSFFSDWATKDISRHLPFLYNLVANDFYTYLPALKKYGKDAKVVHFLGATKPWMTEESGAQGDSFYNSFLRSWWHSFKRHQASSVHQLLSYVTPAVQEGWTGGANRSRWEHGHVDYTGADSFESIQKRIDSKVVKKPASSGHQSPPSSQPTQPSSLRSTQHQPAGVQATQQAPSVQATQPPPQAKHQQPLQATQQQPPQATKLQTASRPTLKLQATTSSHPSSLSPSHKSPGITVVTKARGKPQ